MFHRDYFMRMIEQMTQVVGQVTGLRRERKHEEALYAIDELLDRQFRLNGKLIRSLSDEDLIQMMTTNGVVESPNIYAIAALLKEEGDVYEEMGEGDKSYQSHLKALHLFIRLAMLDNAPVINKPSEEAQKLLNKLSVYELPSATKLLQLDWHEADGQYALAENVLYELMEDGVLGQEAAAEFYRRLLQVPDEQLLAGGLPREEIEESQSQMAKLH
ncbi:DUF6483 family protein [Paenibacillus sp. GCM10027626]|uniref:DUF6483 family protein n=1 Tax=Paenibacillus sp. GCM10027626 TaxID=3273411 RepID=UPI003635EFAC